MGLVVAQQHIDVLGRQPVEGQVARHHILALQALVEVGVVTVVVALGVDQRCTPKQPVFDDRAGGGELEFRGVVVAVTEA